MTSTEEISKTMSYLLRHDPEGMEIDSEGWVDADELLERLRERDMDIYSDRLRRVVERDPKGRFELAEGKIRARYGHSLEEVDPSLPPAMDYVLYHGTSPERAARILSEGLKSKGRQKVHLSGTEEEARSVGRRHAEDPVVLTVDARRAREDGVRIERASSVVYVAEEIPPEYIERKASEGG